MLGYSFFQTLEHLPQLVRKMAEYTKFDSLKKLFPSVLAKKNALYKRCLKCSFTYLDNVKS